ncbi:MAG: PAS domain-containing protein [Desulfobaccales bacterium]
MTDEDRDRGDLIKEVGELRQQVAALEQEESRYQRLSEAWRDLWAQYEAIIEAFDGYIYICSQNYEVEFMNQRFIERTGYYPLGQKCYRALHDRDEVCPWCINDRVFRGETVRWEVLSPKDHRWYYVVNTPIRHADGSMSKMALIQDVTDRKEAEKTLQEVENQYRGIFEHAVIGIFQSTPKGRLLSVNPALARMHGYDSPEEMIAAITDLGHQVFVDPQQLQEFRREMAEAGVIRGREYQVYRKDDSTFRVSVHARAVRDDEGAMKYYEGFVQDLTAPKQNR